MRRSPSQRPHLVQNFSRTIPVQSTVRPLSPLGSIHSLDALRTSCSAGLPALHCIGETFCCPFCKSCSVSVSQSRVQWTYFSDRRAASRCYGGAGYHLCAAQGSQRRHYRKGRCVDCREHLCKKRLFLNTMLIMNKHD